MEHQRQLQTVLCGTKNKYNLLSLTGLVGTGAELSGIRISAAARNFSLLQIAQTAYGAHQLS